MFSPRRVGRPCLRFSASSPGRRASALIHGAPDETFGSEMDERCFLLMFLVASGHHAHLIAYHRDDRGGRERVTDFDTDSRLIECGTVSTALR